MNFLRNLLNGQRHLTMRTLPKIGPVAETHHVNGNSLFEFPDNTQSITFGLGCYWGAERRFWEQKGVWSTQAGYAGGGYPNPTYEETCKGASMKNQHAEVVRVVFDPSEVELESLIQVFWEAHDPTQGDRQGNDRGPQYRSAIYTNSEEDLAIARSSRDFYQAELKKSNINSVITTEIKMLDEFYYAEDYHQQYLSNNHGVTVG